jgi:hypothetical protein
MALTDKAFGHRGFLAQREGGSEMDCPNDAVLSAEETDRFLDAFVAAVIALLDGEVNE